MAVFRGSDGRRRLLPDDNFLGWTPYVWLVYLPTFFIGLLIQKQPEWVWIVTGIACLVFLPLYFAGHWVRGRNLLIIIAAITALGVTVGPLNSSAFAFFIYAASFAGMTKPTRRAVTILVVLSVIIVLEATLFDMSIYRWAWALLFVWIVGGVNTHFSTVQRSDVILKRARDEIERLATVAERERIARDLHDVLGHTLSLITLKSALASRLADRDPDKAIAEIKDVERISREALNEVRAAVAGYRDAGFVGETDNARVMLEAAGIVARVSVAPVLLTANEEAVLALAVREGVTNVVRHSGAGRCEVELRSDAGARVLEITDDGAWKRSAPGNGLTGMRERIESIGGTMEVTTDSGTRLLITLPDRVMSHAPKPTLVGVTHEVA